MSLLQPYCRLFRTLCYALLVLSNTHTGELYSFNLVSVTLLVDLFPPKNMKVKFLRTKSNILHQIRENLTKSPKSHSDANCSCLGPIAIKATLNWSSKRVKEMIKRVFDECNAGESLVFFI